MAWKLAGNTDRIEMLVCKQNANIPLEIDVSEIKILKICFIEPLYRAEKPGEDNPVRIALEGYRA